MSVDTPPPVLADLTSYEDPPNGVAGRVERSTGHDRRSLPHVGDRAGGAGSLGNASEFRSRQAPGPASRPASRSPAKGVDPVASAPAPRLDRSSDLPVSRRP